MTESDFRANPERRAELRQMLDTKTFALARHAITSRMSSQDADLGAPEVASVRLLSLRCGIDDAFEMLERLTQPPADAPKDQPATFGADAEAAMLASALQEDLPPQFQPQ